MHALDVLGDPVRRRILELIVDGEEPAGSIAEVISREFGISQPAVSQHLRVLRQNGFVTVRPEGTRRLYAVDPEGPREASEWLSSFERFWRGPLAALGTELARGKRQCRLEAERPGASQPGEDRDDDRPRATRPDPAHPAPQTPSGWSTRSVDPRHHESKE
ncbi:ArsR/SmtB family transcription factor [Leucobacter celer]|uniref:ArsR/SmtB family transcription factor n=1 Tax=Leucobacter celer TaxID=668625 RepID=UPI0006A7E752|nr:metalloregulator ArsR/SmtB family transcription factor [Leucobacter celer]